MLREPKIGHGFDWGEKFERSVPACRIENYRVSRRIKDNKTIVMRQINAKEQWYTSHCHVVAYTCTF